MIISQRFLRFGVVGVAGFLVDYGSYLLFSSQMSFYLARLFSFVIAVSTTWFLNRSWTFRKNVPARSWLDEWLVYFASMSLGGLFNLGTSLLLLKLMDHLPCAALLALAAGSLAGLVSNYCLSSKVVFKTREC